MINILSSLLEYFSILEIRPLKRFRRITLKNRIFFRRRAAEMPQIISSSFAKIVLASILLRPLAAQDKYRENFFFPNLNIFIS